MGVAAAPWANAQFSKAAVGRQLPFGLAIWVRM
jgi:hypothetical protein